MRILGIDPGSTRIGYGLIESGSNLKALDFGLIEIKAKSISEKLLSLANQFAALLEKTKPDLAAVEKIYFTKNQKTIIEVAQARGIILFLILKNNIPLLEYNPREVKQAVTSYGLADKYAVAKMVCRILNIKEIPKIDDTTDALAIAITAASRYRLDSLQ